MMMHNPDMMKWNRAEQLHVIFRALMQFVAKHKGELPRLNNEEDATEVSELAKVIVQA
jgi:ubiquitin-activating enzyme E1